MTSLPVEQDPALARELEARDHPQGRGLARARRPEHREELAVVDVEIDAGDGTTGRPVAGYERGNAPTGVVVPERLTTPSRRTATDRRRSGAGSRIWAGIVKRDLDWGDPGVTPRAGSGSAALCRAPRSVSSRRRRPSRSARHRLRAVAARRAPAPRARPSRVRRGRTGARARRSPPATREAAATPTPPIVPGRVGRSARGQHHRQGLLVPARRARPRPGRDGPPPCHQRRPRGPRGGHRRRRRSRMPGRWPRRPRRGAPGPTPVVSVPPGVAGVRIVVKSGERVDLVWTVPADGPASATPVGRRLPHPRPLGAWDAGPRPGGSRVARTPAPREGLAGGTLLSPRQRACVRR